MLILSCTFDICATPTDLDREPPLERSLIELDKPVVIRLGLEVEASLGDEPCGECDLGERLVDKDGFIPRGDERGTELLFNRSRSMYESFCLTVESDINVGAVLSLFSTLELDVLVASTATVEANFDLGLAFIANVNSSFEISSILLCISDAEPTLIIVGSFGSNEI